MRGSRGVGGGKRAERRRKWVGGGVGGSKVEEGMVGMKRGQREEA